MSAAGMIGVIFIVLTVIVAVVEWLKRGRAEGTSRRSGAVGPGD